MSEASWAISVPFTPNENPIFDFLRAKISLLSIYLKILEKIFEKKKKLLLLPVNATKFPFV